MLKYYGFCFRYEQIFGKSLPSVVVKNNLAEMAMEKAARTALDNSSMVCGMTMRLVRTLPPNFTFQRNKTTSGCNMISDLLETENMVNKTQKKYPNRACHLD